MITAATIAALNQHLANIGFLPRVDATPPDEPIPPMARDAPTIPPISLPHLCEPAPGSVFPSSYSMNNAIHHLQDGSPPVTHNPLAHTRFSHDFVSKYKRSTVLLTLAASREYSPFNFLPTRIERQPRNSLLNLCAMHSQEFLTWLTLRLGDHEIPLMGFRLPCPTSQTDESVDCTQPRWHAHPPSPHR